MNPEHIHLLLNHAPVHGLGVATLILVIGLFFKQQNTIGIACVAVLLTSLSIPFVMGSGEGAYERYKQLPEIRENLTDRGLEYAHEHYEHAEKGAKLTYLLVLLSGATVLSWKYRPSWFLKLAIATVIFSIVCLVANAWISSSGGKIRRPDFQQSSVESSRLKDH